jgi:hypothetical protein
MRAPTSLHSQPPQSATRYTSWTARAIGFEPTVACLQQTPSTAPTARPTRITGAHHATSHNNSAQNMICPSAHHAGHPYHPPRAIACAPHRWRSPTSQSAVPPQGAARSACDMRNSDRCGTRGRRGLVGGLSSTLQLQHPPFGAHPSQGVLGHRREHGNARMCIAARRGV